MLRLWYSSGGIPRGTRRTPLLFLLASALVLSSGSLVLVEAGDGKVLLATRLAQYKVVTVWASNRGAELEITTFSDAPRTVGPSPYTDPTVWASRSYWMGSFLGVDWGANCIAPGHSDGPYIKFRVLGRREFVWISRWTMLLAGGVTPVGSFLLLVRRTRRSNRDVPRSRAAPDVVASGSAGP
jgi:hypothetical protein